MFSVSNPRPISRDTWRVGCRRIALEVDDMQQTTDYLKARGISTTKPIESETSIRAEFEDPDGLSIEMIQYLKSGRIDL